MGKSLPCVHWEVHNWCSIEKMLCWWIWCRCNTEKHLRCHCSIPVVLVLPPLSCKQSLYYLEFDAVLSCSAYNLMRDCIKSECGDLARGHMRLIFDSNNTVLCLTPDMEVLDSKDGLLTTPLMDYITIWFQTILPVDVLLCNSLVGCSLRALVEKPLSTSALHKFYTKKSGFKRMKGRTIMVPVFDCNH